MILVFGNWAVVTYEIPKVIVFQWVVRILALILAYSFFRKPRKWRVDPLLAKMILTFVAVVFVSAFFGVNIAKSFIGNFYRGDGIVTFLSLVGFSFIVSYFWKEEFNIYFAEVLFWVSTLLAGFSLFSPFVPQLSNISAAGFGNSVFLAGFLVTALPFSFYYVRENIKRRFIFGFIVQVISLFFLNATASVIVLFVFVFLILMRYAKSKRKNLFGALLLLSGLAIGLLWLRDYSIQSSTSLIAEGRARIFINGLQGFAQSSLLGYGWANFDAAFQKGTWPMRLNNDVYVDKAHSEFLEVLVATGAIGFLAYLAFIYNLYRKLKTGLKTDWGHTLFAVFVIYLLHSQTNVTSITEQILFWFVVGVSLREI